MKVARIRWLAIGASLLVLGLGYLSLNRQVTVLADGRAHEIITRALTVRGALHVAGIQLGPQDAVEPSQFSLLQNGLIIAVHRAAFIQLSADGKVYSIFTAEHDPGALLAKWNLSLGDDDRLLLAGQTMAMDEQLPSLPALALEVRRAVEVTLEGDDQITQFLSSAPTLGQAIAEQGIQLQAADRLQPAAETPLDADLEAVLVRARAIEITMGDETISLRSAAPTVGEALADAGIALQGLDRSEPDEDASIPADGKVRVRRITESVLLEQTRLPHETEWQPDAAAELDTISVVELGQDGVQAARTRVRYEDGEETSRKEEEQRVLVEATTQINGYGTLIVLRTIVINDVTIEYYRAVNVFTTWYSACNSGVSGCLYGTSTAGVPLAKGVIATYLSWYRALKLATVYIPGYGPGTIADVGVWPDRSVPWMDLAFDEPVAGNPWNNQYITVYFTTPIPAYVPPIWPPG